MSWCYHGTHKAPCHTFVFDGQEHSECNQCSKRKHKVTPPIVKTLEDNAVPAEHWELIEKSNSELDKLERLAWDLYNKIDFDMGIQ